MYHPTTRVLTVLELLQSHGRMTGAELARRLEVNIRTARHYIELLQELGIPVEAERGRYGAYRLRPGYKLPPLFFTEEEAFALTLGLLVSRQIGLTSTAPAIEGTLAKVERVLPQQVRSRLTSMEQTLVLDIGVSHGAPTSTVVMALSTAVKAGQRVRIRYRAAQQEESERVLDPYGIIYRQGFWYTIGYCHLRQGQRLFRVDRILHVALLNETFTPPQNYDTLEAVERALASIPSEWHVEVLLETALEQVSRWISPSNAQLEERPDGVIFRCYTEDLDWMARFLSGFDVPFTILYPPELRSALHQHALKLIDYAGHPGG